MNTISMSARHCRHWRMFLPLLFFIPTAFARFCVDDKKGWCEAHGMWGWCFHNKTSGTFNCDDEDFCASQDMLRNKRSNGCFLRGEETMCCCNDVDGCNLGFLGMPPKTTHGQKCSNGMEEPGEDPRLFKPCEDPWCYSILTSDTDGGPTTVQRGCYSRKMVMHHLNIKEDKAFHNNSRWQATEVLAERPSCSDIVEGEEYLNGTQSLCFDFTYETEEEERRGRLCCCRGTDKCNEMFTWAHPSIDEEEMKERTKMRALLTAAVSEITHIFTATLSLFVSYFLLP